jgi:hypothetical protein
LSKEEVWQSANAADEIEMLDRLTSKLSKHAMNSGAL